MWGVPGILRMRTRLLNTFVQGLQHKGTVEEMGSSCRGLVYVIIFVKLSFQGFIHVAFTFLLRTPHQESQEAPLEHQTDLCHPTLLAYHPSLLGQKRSIQTWKLELQVKVSWQISLTVCWVKRLAPQEALVLVVVALEVGLQAEAAVYHRLPKSQARSLSCKTFMRSWTESHGNQWRSPLPHLHLLQKEKLLEDTK